MTFQTFITEYLTWFISAATVYGALKTGSLHRHAMLISLAIQVLWLAWIVASKTWGLVPLNIILSIVYVRNHLKWKRALSETSNGKTS